MLESTHTPKGATIQELRDEIRMKAMRQQLAETNLAQTQASSPMNGHLHENQIQNDNPYLAASTGLHVKSKSINVTKNDYSRHTSTKYLTESPIGPLIQANKYIDLLDPRLNS